MYTQFHISDPWIQTDASYCEYDIMRNLNPKQEYLLESATLSLDHSSHFRSMWIQTAAQP